MHRHQIPSTHACIERLEPRLLLSGSVVITEFMASNGLTLLDGDGKSSDWIELYNPTASTVDLAGWYLTDDHLVPTKWPFPTGGGVDTTLDPGEYRIIMASDEDDVYPYVDSLGYLHTSFKLSTNDDDQHESVLLVRPDHSVAHGFEDYPTQYTDVSFGLEWDTTSSVVMTSAAAGRVVVPDASHGPIGTAWTALTGYDDSAWLGGQMGAGFDVTAARPFDPLIGTDIEGQMLDNNASAYIRIPFTYDSSPDELLKLTLNMQYDDGFAAYLNGEPVDDANAPASPGYNSSALDNRDDAAAMVAKSFVIDNAAQLIRSGANMLAIHGLNASADDANFLIRPELVAVTGRISDPENPGYFAEGTPGGPNVSAPGRDPLKRIVINELHVNPADNTEKVEFIELYNNTAEPIDLSGWYFSDGVEFTFPAGSSIASGQYAVVGESPSEVQSKFGISGAYGPFVGNLANEGERIVLRDSEGTRQDEVDYGLGFPWPTTGGWRDYSMELIDPNLDNDLGGSWRASAGADASEEVFFETGGSWKYFKGTSEPSAPGQWRERTGFDDSSWLTGEGAIGYSSEGDERAHINTNLADMNGGYTTVYFRKEFTVSDPSTVGALELHARVDDGLVVWINGELVHGWNVRQSSPDFWHIPYDATSRVTVDNADLVRTALPEPSTYLVAGTNVISVQLFNDSLSSSDAFWDARLVAPSSEAPPGPTPKVENSVHATNAAPQMRQLTHTPIQPVAGEDVTVTVKVTDGGGVASVSLDYQVVNPGGYIRIDDSAYQTNWTTLAMADDGAGGDAVADDDVYTVVLPASIQTHRRLVRYRITAEDTLGATVTGPYADDPQPNFAYFVYDGIPAWTGADRPGVTAAHTFDTGVMNSLPAYHLIANAADVTNSQYNGSYQDVRFHGTMVYDGVVYDHIEFRVRGEFSTYVAGKNKWKLFFNRGHDFQARDPYGQEYNVAWRTMNLTAAATPWMPVNRGMAGIGEAIAFKLYDLAGVPSPNMNPLQLRVIDSANETDPSSQYNSDLWGLYWTLEYPDGRFLDERGLPDGNVYKMEGNNGDKKHQGATDPIDNSDVNAFKSGYNSNPSIDWWRDNVDLDAYYSFRSVNREINNMDLRDGWNVYYYHNADTGQWTPIPWDLDMLYAPTTHWSGVINIQKSIQQHSQLNIEYQARGRELQDLLFNADQLGMLVDEYAGFVNPPGQPWTMADVDQFMWNYSPRTSGSHTGAFYRNPADSDPWGPVVNRYLATADHEGMAQWIKDFMLPAPGGGSSPVAYGFDFLAGESADGNIPYTPTASYVGQAGYPIDDLSFRTSAFGDPQGSGTFAAMEWRIAEITDPADPDFDPAQPRKYEINPLWESGELTSFSDTIAIDGHDLAAGHTYRVRVRMKDTTGRWSHWSAPVQFVAGDADPYVLEHLRITEVNYHPHDPTPAEIAAGHDNRYDFEFVELQNTGSRTLDLTDVRFTGAVSFDFSTSAVTSLAPGQRVVVAKDPAALTYRYGAGVSIAGNYVGLLDDAGERMALSDAFNRFIADFAWDNSGSWPGRADGKGATLEIIDPAGSYDGPDNWRSSVAYGGTPGAASEAPVGVVVNEVLTHTDAPDSDTIELHNTTGADINIGGWYLSDSWGWDATGVRGNYKKFRIPDGTVIGAGQYLTFNESHFNPTLGADPRDFALSGAHGDDVWLMKADGAGRLTHFADHVDLPAAPNGQSLGRWPNATGDIYPMAHTTLAADNTPSGPARGQVVITEIMYHPPDATATGGIPPGDLEFIELYNATAETVHLARWLDNPHVAGQQYFADWRLRGGVDMEFDLGVTIDPGRTLVVLSFNPDSPANADRVAAFKAWYGIAPGASPAMVGGFGGWLDNRGDPVRLQRPDSPPLDEADFVPHTLEDEVRYDELSPWPAGAGGTGLSIHRLDSVLWGNDPASWTADAPTPGSVDFADTTAPTVTALGLAATGSTLGTVDSAMWTTGRSARTAPWSVLDKLVVTFGEPVTAAVGDLALVGIDSGELTATAINGSGTNTVTWTVAAGEFLASDRYTVALIPTVTDMSGNPLADFRTADLNVLVGDITGDGRVSSRDRRDLRDAYGSSSGSANYTLFADLNADGRISSRDRRALRNSYGAALPDPPPLPPPTPLAYPPYSQDLDSIDPLAAPSSGRPAAEDVFVMAALSGALAVETKPALRAGPVDGELAIDALVSIQTLSTDVPTVVTPFPPAVQPRGTAWSVDADAPAAAQLEPDIGTDPADILGEQVDVAFAVD